MELASSIWADFVRGFSEDRLSSYCKHCSEKPYDMGLARYFWNQELSAELYPWLTAIEITLRNAIHDALSREFNNEYWFDSPDIIHKPYEAESLKKAKLNVKKQNKSISSGQIVAELSFGFWTSLFHSEL